MKLMILSYLIIFTSFEILELFRIVHDYDSRRISEFSKKLAFDQSDLSLTYPSRKIHAARKAHVIIRDHSTTVRFLAQRYFGPWVVPGQKIGQKIGQ